MDPDALRWFVPSNDDHARLGVTVGKVLARHPWVKAAYLYGSVARADRPSRDIDVGLLGDPPPGWGAELDIAAELQRETALHAEFDVRLLGGSDPVFLGAVLRDGRLLYEADREARIRFETRAMSLWLDYRPVWERVRREVARRWADE